MIIIKIQITKIMAIFTAPEKIFKFPGSKSIFLAGTIEMGNSEDWQKDFIRSATRYDYYNPRREEWDNSWEQRFENPQFFQQVSWELDAMDKADLIVMNLLPESKSPISLLELGLYANSGKLVVVCPDEFYRSGNVNIVCNKYNILVFKNIEAIKINLFHIINSLTNKK